jgi:hypothetical protein
MPAETDIGKERASKNKTTFFQGKPAIIFLFFPFPVAEYASFGSGIGALSKIWLRLSVIGAFQPKMALFSHFSGIPYSIRASLILY